MATLDVAVEEILDDIVAVIEAAANETGGGLNEVQTVIRGAASRPLPVMPAVWVIAQSAQYEQTDYGNDENWTLDVTLAALVKSDDPAEGARTAQRVAARAKAAVLTIRHPRTRDYIVDVTARSYDPNARRGQRDPSIFWTDATVRVSFTANDVD